MITQSINLNLIPGGVLPRINVSQYDKGSRTLQFVLFNGPVLYSIESGTEITIQGSKPDNTAFQYSCTWSGSTASMDIEQQMTAVAGDVICELVISNNGEILGTCNFILNVESAAVSDDTVISETDIPLIERAVEAAVEAAQSATDAAASAQAAAQSAASIGIATTSDAGIVKPDGTTITVDSDGTIHGNESVTVDTELSTTSENPVQNKVISLALGKVETTIAPVETDPASNAWAVGRQIIYNDNLYEVITAITAGDSLVAYEDDPTNANIKLADPVETQLLNEITSRQTGDTELRNALTNPNLLDNPWFTVNQRGATTVSESGVYFVDRWRTYINTVVSQSYTLNNGVLTIDNTSGSSSMYLLQRSETSVKEALRGKLVTASVLLSDGTILSGTREFPSVYINTNDLMVYSGTNNTEILTIEVKGGKTVSIRAMKLELGSISTLAMDTAPNYVEELLKCQRYFNIIKSPNNSYKPIGFGYMGDTQKARIAIPLSVPMRANPTIVISNVSKFRIYGETNKSITAMSLIGIENNIVHLEVTTDSSSGTQYGPAFLADTTKDEYISFSADL